MGGLDGEGERFGVQERVIGVDKMGLDGAILELDLKVDGEVIDTVIFSEDCLDEWILEEVFIDIEREVLEEDILDIADERFLIEEDSDEVELDDQRLGLEQRDIISEVLWDGQVVEGDGFEGVDLNGFKRNIGIEGLF